MPLDGHLMQVVHKSFSQALSAEMGCYSHSADVSVPIFDLIVIFKAFNFADELALYVRNSVLTDNGVLSPLVEVLPVKVCVESLSEQVQINIVELEQVKHVHLSDSRHFELFYK